MPPYKERVASVPNPIAKLPPLGTAAEMDKRIQGLRDMLEAQNASMAEDSYIDIDSHISSTVLFPNVKEDLLSSDALWTHHETSVAKVCPSVYLSDHTPLPPLDCHDGNHCHIILSSNLSNHAFLS